MTETTKTIFEKYEIRKTKKQKALFRKYVGEYATSLGYQVKEEKGSLGARNIVVGDPEGAKVIYTAHYDTCPRLPFPNFITPKCIWLYLLYQLLITVVLLAVIGVVEFGIGVACALIENATGFPLFLIFGLPLSLLPVVVVCGLMLVGPANKHTANDNTSGVTLLLDIMTALPQEQRAGVAFVFFDLEEVGVLGSASFASAHKGIRKNTLIVNYDCVSDGENILFVLNKRTKQFKDAFAQAFADEEGVKVEIAEKGVIYPSDQMNFKLGVGVAALKKSKGGLLYMDKIHTKKDVVYRERNIEFLRDGSVRLAEII